MWSWDDRLSFSVIMPFYTAGTPLLFGQLRRCLVQEALGVLLRQAGISHVVEPPHLRLSRDEGPGSGSGSGITRPTDILLYSWRGDRHCCVDLVNVSPAHQGWRDAALLVFSQEKRDEHTQTCASHCFNFVPFDFSIFLLLRPCSTRAA